MQHFSMFKNDYIVEESTNPYIVENNIELAHHIFNQGYLF